MRIFLVLLFLSATPAIADWRVTSFVDRMTDKRSAIAELSATNVPTLAVLQVTCNLASSGIPTHLHPVLHFSGTVGFHDIGVSYRYDNGPVIPRIAPVSKSGHEVWLWLGDYSASKELGRAKRLRATLFPTGGNPLFLDFDLLGAADAIKKVPCG